MKFEIGQNVICIKTHSQGAVKKDEIYTVGNVSAQPCCGKIQLDVGVRAFGCRYCGECQKGHNYAMCWWINADLFVTMEAYMTSLAIAESLFKELELTTE